MSISFVCVPSMVKVPLPVHTVVSVWTIDRINSRTHRATELFRGFVDPIVVDDRVIVPPGADASLKLIYARSAGHMPGRKRSRPGAFQHFVSGQNLPRRQL